MNAKIRVGSHYFVMANCRVCDAEHLARAGRIHLRSGPFCSKKCAGQFRKLPPPIRAPVEPYEDRLRRRFDSFTDKSGTCWIWIGASVTSAKSPDYKWGVINVHDQARKASRVSWELNVGPLPAGLNVLHHCDNPLCVNPAHLFLGTQADNMTDMDRKGRRRTVALSGDNHWKRRASVTRVEDPSL